jgi:hypothetical protein
VTEMLDYVLVCDTAVELKFNLKIRLDRRLDWCQAPLLTFGPGKAPGEEMRMNQSKMMKLGRSVPDQSNVVIDDCVIKTIMEEKGLRGPRNRSDWRQ